MIHSDNWQSNFEALKAHVAQTGHFPDKHTRLNNWCRYQRKRMKAGTMTVEQRALFEALATSRSGEHTGGRRRKLEGVFRLRMGWRLLRDWRIMSRWYIDNVIYPNAARMTKYYHEHYSFLKDIDDLCYGAGKED